MLLIRFLVKKEENPSYLPVFIGVALMMILAVALLLVTTNEKKIAAEIAAEYGGETDAEEESGTAEQLAGDNGELADIGKTQSEIYFNIHFSVVYCI